MSRALRANPSIFKVINQIEKIEFDPNDPLIVEAQKMVDSAEYEELRADIQKKTDRLRPELQGNIEFKDVWFRFPVRSDYTLRGLSLQFNVGTNCAIVGASGAGKSTIFQLLLRFYDVNKGQILIDGYDIRSIDLKHLRSFFGLIKQEPELFNGTIRYNIKYNLEDATEEEIRRVCEISNSEEFITAHEEGFERDVGNRGDVLSGGQKQRVTIARVLLRNPRVFLFDEATSALDSNSEIVVQRAIEKIWSDHSSFTIAHRFSTIKKCDVIYVLERGTVVEQGGYDELMAKKGIFFEMSVD